jgi:hypothetical protein
VLEHREIRRWIVGWEKRPFFTFHGMQTRSEQNASSIQLVTVSLSLEMKRPRYDESYYTCKSLKKIKNVWRYNSTPLYAFMGNTDTVFLISCILLFN